MLEHTEQVQVHGRLQGIAFRSLQVPILIQMTLVRFTHFFFFKELKVTQ